MACINKKIVYAFILYLIAYVVYAYNYHFSYVLYDIGLLLLLFSNNNRNEIRCETKTTKFMLFSFGIFNIYLIIRFLFFDHEGWTIVQSLLNSFLVPATLILFVYQSKVNRSTIVYLLSKTYIVILIALICSFFSPLLGLSLLAMVAPLYFLQQFSSGHMNNKNRLLVIATCIALYWYIFNLESRSILFLLLILVAGCTIVNLWPKMKKKFFYICVTICVLFPLLLFVYNISLFDVSNYITTNTSGSIYEDTRTFVYYETIETLLQKNSLLIGLGLNGRILTTLQDFVDLTVDQNGARLFVEAGFLEYLKRGGILYLALYCAFLLIPCYRLLMTEDKLNNILGIYILASFVTSLIGVTPQCSMSYLALILCCAWGYNKNMSEYEKNVI